MGSSSFALHPQLEQDSIWVEDLFLSEARLHKNAAWPWVVLVPRTAEPKQELVDLSEEDSRMVHQEIRIVSTALRHLFKPDKLNMGILGNKVPQLHIHLLARYTVDPAWPEPVWGHSAYKEYSPEALSKRVGDLAEVLQHYKMNLRF